MILSAIEDIASTSNVCASGSANLGHPVFTQQITLGNSALRASDLGTVSASSMLADGSGTVANPCTDTTVRADAILNLLPTMYDGQIAYVSETYYKSSDLDITGYLTASGVYARAIF